MGTGWEIAGGYQRFAGGKSQVVIPEPLLTYTIL
jgi:hypothetical protein